MFVWLKVENLLVLFLRKSSSSESELSLLIKFPTLNEMISQYETLVHPIKPAKIIGVSLNTFDLTFDQSLEVVELVEAETGLPTTDVIRFGSEKLVNSIIDVSKKKDLLNASLGT